MYQSIDNEILDCIELIHLEWDSCSKSQFFHLVAIFWISNIQNVKVQILFPWWLQCGEAFSYVPKMLYAISPELKPFFFVPLVRRKVCLVQLENFGVTLKRNSLNFEKKLIDRLPSSDIIWDLIWDSWGPPELVQPSLKRLK